MRLKFSVEAIACSPQSTFPASVINRVIVCCRDGCSYQHVTEIQNGKFDVDFELAPRDEGAVLSSTLKFHFYSGDTIPFVIAAGPVPLTQITDLMAGKKPPPLCFRGNFSPVFVNVNLIPPATPVKVALPKLKTSALELTDLARHFFILASNGVSRALQDNIEMNAANGAPMFCNLMTSHNMENQFTTHMHFQKDVEPCPQDSVRFYKTGLTLTSVAEALHAQCLTADEVLAMDTEETPFTQFVSGVCQSFMRSAHVCPYWFDKVLDPALDSAGQVQQVMSESFKLPFREPFFGMKSKATFMNADDCEGQATFMLHLFRSFQHLYERHKDSDPSMAFPQHLFSMAFCEKQKLWDIAMRIGQMASVGSLRCDIVLLSAGSAALGDGGSQLGGHATAVLVNASDADKPVDILMEGTNSMVWDDDPRTLTLETKERTVQLALPQVANLLTQQISNLYHEPQPNDSRHLIHLSRKTEKGFYKTAFCQNGVLLGTKSGETLQYGINMDCISNYDMKVLMPVSPSILNGLAQTQEAHKILEQHCARRAKEIHPPPVPVEKVAEATASWSPIDAYAHPPELRGRQYKVCLAMESVRDPQERADLLANKKAVIQKWNAKYQDVGFCSVYAAIDTVFTRLCFWTDDLKKLEATLSAAMDKSPPCSGRS